MRRASINWLKPKSSRKTEKLQTASKRKLDSYRTAAICGKKSTRTADIPISIPTRIPTILQHRFAIGQPKTVKAANKPTTSTATKSAFQEKWPIRTATSCGTANTPPGAVWKKMSGFIRTHIPRGTYKKFISRITITSI